MSSRKPGVCSICGAKTQRTSNTRCKIHRSASLPATSATPPAFDVSLTSHTPLTLPLLLEAFDIDSSQWQVKTWNQTKRETGKAPTFAAKATLVARPKDVGAEMREWLSTFGTDAPERVSTPTPDPNGCYLLHLALPDAHIGKLCWGEETGGANYDTKIAVRLYREAIEALLARTSAFTPEHIVLAVGNDFYHSDTKAGTTTKGTPLDVDSRFPRMFKAGVALIVETAERLAQIAPVSLVMVRGNHDEVSNYCLGEVLEAWFRNTRAVMVDNTPTSRKYMQYGTNMLAWTHGDRGKLANLPLLMATERSKMFGDTKFRTWFTGDKHTLRVEEEMGVQVRISPALCPADAWHADMQFVGNLRSAEAFVFDKREGLVAQASYTVQ